MTDQADISGSRVEQELKADKFLPNSFVAPVPYLTQLNMSYSAIMTHLDPLKAEMAPKYFEKRCKCPFKLVFQELPFITSNSLFTPLLLSPCLLVKIFYPLSTA